MVLGGLLFVLVFKIVSAAVHGGVVGMPVVRLVGVDAKDGPECHLRVEVDGQSPPLLPRRHSEGLSVSVGPYTTSRIMEKVLSQRSRSARGKFPCAGSFASIPVITGSDASGAPVDS